MGTPCSWTPEEYQVESCEHQDNANIHCQPFPESVSEEREIYSDYDGCHRHPVKHDNYLSAHFSLILCWRLGRQPSEARLGRFWIGRDYSGVIRFAPWRVCWLHHYRGPGPAALCAFVSHGLSIPLSVWIFILDNSQRRHKGRCCQRRLPPLSYKLSHLPARAPIELP
jgi:hypothetical protein